MRRAEPVKGFSPSGVTAAARVTRPDAPRVVLRSRSGGVTPSCLATALASSAIGPKLWCGEASSYGSATETRYGIARPVASSALSVRPPEVEKKYVVATLPS